MPVEVLRPASGVLDAYHPLWAIGGKRRCSPLNSLWLHLNSQWLVLIQLWSEAGNQENLVLGS